MYLCAVLKLSELKLCNEFEVTLKLAVISCRIIWASLSESHTSGAALQDACVCLSVCVRPYTENLN